MTTAIDDTLRAWTEQVTGGRLVSAHVPATGGSRTQYFVDVATDDGIERFVLRCEAGGSFTGTTISPSREAVVYRALEATAVPVPHLVALAPDGAALLLERVPGSSDLDELDEPTRTATLAAFVDALADLHRLDVETIELPGFARPRNAEEHATLDLAEWQRLVDEWIPELDPIVRYSGAWLRAHAPGHVERTSLVQGDTGPGNFVALDGAITGIVDWEFAHIGDPMDDWAWLRYRCRGELRRVLDELEPRYTRRCGLRVDPASVAYYELAVQYRCAVTTSLAVARGGGSRGLAPYLMMTEQYVLGVAERLSELTGVREAVTASPLPVTPRTRWYEALIEGLRAAAKGIDDAGLRNETRNLQIFVHYLRGHDASGAAASEADRADCLDTLGFDSITAPEAGAALEAAGAAQDERVLRYLFRRTTRERALWASLLDRSTR